MTIESFGYRYLDDSNGSPEITINQNLLANYVLHKGIVDRDLTAPPGSPADGDAYIPAATATGVWAGHEDEIAYWFDEVGVWKFLVPDVGVAVYVNDEDIRIQYLGGSSGWGVVAGSGTVTSVGGTGTVAGLTLTGTVTSAGNLTLGGTLSVDLTSMVTGVLPLANMTGTTVGKNVLNLTNPSAIRFLRLNADNTVDALSDSAFRTAIGVGTGSGTVTQVDGAGTVAGLTLTGSVTTSGSLTLGGTIAVPIANITASTSDPIGVGSINLGHATDTTLTRVSAGVIAVEGATVYTQGGALGTPASGNASNMTADGTNPVGFKNIPQNSKSAAYTTVAGDAGFHIYHPSADTTARIWTIDSNANVPYPIGTAITFINDTSGGVITIAITSDTLVLAGAGTTGSRTLAANGVATAVKMTSTRWIISGTGLS